MFVLRFNWSKILFTGVVLWLLTSCGGGGDDDKVIITEIALHDPANILDSIGVTSLDELKEKFATKSARTISLELTEADPDIKAELVVNLLKQNNRNIEFQKLKDKNVSDDIIAKINELPLSPVQLKRSIKLPDSTIFPMPDLTPQAIELYNVEKLKVLNRKLKLADQLPLDLTQFKQLQTAFSQVEIVDNFGNLDQKFQNVLVKDNASRYAAKGAPVRANRSPELEQLPGFYYGNYAMESNAGLGTDDAFADNCYIIDPQLPLPVSQIGSTVNSNLVTTDSGNAIVKLPYAGIAVFAVSSESEITLNLQRSDGFSLLNQQVAGTYYIYLPVTQNDVCQPFTFIGASNNYSIRLIEIKTPERLTQPIYFEGNEYLSAGTEIELINSNPYFNAKSYTFSSINSLLNSIDVLFKMDAALDGNTGFDVMVFSPSDNAYLATQIGMNGFHFAQGFASDITREHGVWRIDLLPPGSMQTSQNKLVGVTAKESVNYDSGEFLTVLTSVNTDPQVQTREFVLGLMNNVSLKTQGDDGALNEGEISLTLNTTMAPKLSTPSYLEDLIARGGTMNDQLALWQCWVKSDKTGLEFEIDAECYEYKDEFERRQELYEGLRTYDYQGDPQYYECRDENGDSAVCIKGENGPYDDLNITEKEKVQKVMDDYANTMNREYSDVEYLNILTNYYDLYLNWKDRSVQIDTGKFPYDGLAYKTRESSVCNIEDDGCVTSGGGATDLLPYFDSPVIIETNRPIFGVPADRVNESTLPINFDYLAIDQDEYDTDAELFAVLSYAATQVYNVATGNFVGLVCNSVGLLDDLHQLEMDAEDDPLGSARVSINRYSISDPFYGLHTAKDYNFYISGLPENNTQIDTYGQQQNYAQMACGIANLATSGYNFYQRADFLLSLDYAQFGEHADLVQSISGIAAAINSTELALQAEEIATMIENGQIDEAKERLKLNSNVTNLTQGTDVYADLESLLDTFSNEASAANGNNIIKSNAQYLLGDGRKTRAQIEFQRIHSVPVSSLSVTLDSVKIISNYESDSHAEVQLKPYVGLISDRPRGGLNTHSLFSDEDTGSNAPSGYLRFNDVADGDLLTPNARLFSSTGSNVAAIYVELAIIEDDGMSAEDDDMIGVFSQTFKLEEIFNTNAKFKWAYLGGDQYRLEVKEFPVYNSSNQRSLENPLSEDYDLQIKHNQTRSPSALVSLTLLLQVGDLTEQYPQLDSAIAVTEVNAGKDTYSMNMNEINSIDIADLYNPELFDTFSGLSIVTPSGYAGVEGTVFRYNSETFALAELFRYDTTGFSGDLLPIQQALTSTNTIEHYVNDGQRQNRPPALIKLLSDNRLLFAISGDDGAKLMVVSFTDQGAMTLLSSQNIVEDDASLVYTLMGATLSPDRSGLLVTYVPETYKNGDKTQSVHPKVLYYQLQGNDFIYQGGVRNDAGTVAGAEFIGNNAFSLTLKKLAYASPSSTVWDALSSYEKELHSNCSSDAMTCLFEVLSQDLFIYQIDIAGDINLIDSFSHYISPYITYPSGKTVNYYTTLRQHLTGAAGMNHAETISATETTAVLRYHRIIYQLSFDMNVDGFVKVGSSSLVPTKQILYNPVGQYYCAEGLSCSGYLQAANDANRNNEVTYVSPETVIDFDFADYQRDLILNISTQGIDDQGNSCALFVYVDTIGASGYVGGTSFIRNSNCSSQSQLKLTSLYDGPAAFKGPQISGDIFDTEVITDGANNTVAMDFTFDVSDRDTRIDQLTVNVTAQNNPFNEVIKAPFQAHSPLYTAQCITAEDGHGSCTGRIIADYENASFKQTVTVSVSDGLYTSARSFTLFVDREAPVLADQAHIVQLATADAYQSMDLTFDSLSSASALNCTNIDYCYLIHNGFVDEWDWVNKPTWLSCVEQPSAAFGSQLLRCTGQPPMGQAGRYMMQVNAYQNKGSSYEKPTSMMLTIDVVEPDIQPDSFAFSTQSDTNLDTLIESNSVTVSGLTGYASLSLDNGEYWRSSTGVWSSAAASNIVNGETIRLRLRSSVDFSTPTTANLSIGGVLGSFTLHTKVDPNANDTTPDAFSFLSAIDQEQSTLIESNVITVSGINEPSPVTILNGEYKIGKADWSQQAGQIINGESILVRHTSATDYETIVVTELTIGGVSAEFSSTTQALLAPQFGPMVINEPMINETFEFTPINSGGEVQSWSINNKPSWASFNTSTGVLSGVVNSLDNFSIDITASNSSGSDTFTTTVSVIANTPPYINGYAVDCYIDEDTCDFTFTDNADWRASVTLVTMGAPYGFGAETTLSSPVDYELSEGQLRLHFNANNQMVKSGGDYEITLLSNSYSEVNISVHVIEGEVILSYVNIDPALAVGTTSTFSMHAANRFGVPVTALYPELTQLNNDPTLVERFQYRQASDYGDSNIWKTFGNWNELAVDGDGNLSFDVKLPGCIDINDGFDLLAGNLSWIYRNIDEACKDVDWAIRYQLYTGDNRNIVIDSQHQMYRVLVDDHQLYLVKYDRNGIEKWTKTLTSNGTNWFEGIEIYNDQLYITGSTNIDIDGAGDGLSLGSFDLFVQRLDLDGELVWSKQFGTSGTDYTYGMTINNDLIDILARIETQANMTGSTVIYQMDLDANNLQMTLDSATLGTGGGGFTPIQVDNSGTYYLAFSNGIKKYNSNGTLEAENVEFGSFTDMLLKDDALYISMDATSAYADEVWNDDEAKAVRVVRLRTSDLSVVWSKLIQSDAPYDGLENSNGQLALHNGVVYLSVVAHKELYYQGLELTETPLYTLNLIALNADGEDDSNGNNSGAGYILGQKSWVTGPAHASDDRENPYLANTELSISTAGWLHLSLNVKQNFVSTAQIGRVQTSPYPYYTNSVLMKTQLEVTAIPLTQLQTGISRNNATEIVTDFDHNIQWDDRFGAVFANDTWAVADNTCSGLSLNGEDDWRLPTLEEFMVDGYIPLPGSVFSHYEDPENEMPHWTSEVVNENSHVAVVIGSWGDGFPNDDSLNYRCVRTMP